MYRQMRNLPRNSYIEHNFSRVNRSVQNSLDLAASIGTRIFQNLDPKNEFVTLLIDRFRF